MISLQTDDARFFMHCLQDRCRDSWKFIVEVLLVTNVSSTCERRRCILLPLPNVHSSSVWKVACKVFKAIKLLRLAGIPISVLHYSVKFLMQNRLYSPKNRDFSLLLRQKGSKIRTLVLDFFLNSSQLGLSMQQLGSSQVHIATDVMFVCDNAILNSLSPSSLKGLLRISFARRQKFP